MDDSVFNVSDMFKKMDKILPRFVPTLSEGMPQSLERAKSVQSVRDLNLLWFCMFIRRHGVADRAHGGV